MSAKQEVEECMAMDTTAMIIDGMVAMILVMRIRYG